MKYVQANNVERSRAVLKQYLNRKVQVTGTVEWIGITRKHHGRELQFPALLLKNVKVTVGSRTFELDHIWVPLKGEMKYVDVIVGDTVSLEAKVVKYYKAPRIVKGIAACRVESYGLSNARRIKVLARKNENGYSVLDALKQLV